MQNLWALNLQSKSSLSCGEKSLNTATIDAYKLLGNIKGLLAGVEPKMLESLISSVTDYRFQEALEEVVELFAELERSSPASQ